MSIEVTPRGTRGTKAPPSGVLGRAITRVAQFVHRRTGNKLAGAPLLYLTTIGWTERLPSKQRVAGSSPAGAVP